MACNSRGWAGVFSVKRGKKGLLDRNHGLQFKGLGWGFSIKRGEKSLLDRNYGLQFIGLCWGFQCEKGVKRTTGQNSWPAIQGAVMELFSVKGEIKLIGSNKVLVPF